MSKSHAVHNQQVCDYLFESQLFNDWVITTAFYSALHHVQSKIFPLTENNITFENMDYYFSYSKKTNKQISKHQLTLKLVRAKLPESYSYYNWLFDACMNARYKNYKVPRQKSALAVRGFAFGRAL
jgi:hypothetical protein